MHAVASLTEWTVCIVSQAHACIFHMHALHHLSHACTTSYITTYSPHRTRKKKKTAQGSIPGRTCARRSSHSSTLQRRHPSRRSSSSSISGIEMKSPPKRPGITFKVGAELEARDRQKNWYCATIEKMDYEKEQVQVHYKQWSRRHDEWFPWSSPYLRPLESTSLRKQGLRKQGLRKQGLRQTRTRPMFGPGARVLACWTDCKFYPAKVIRANKDESYTVRFDDSVVRTVKPTKIKPFKKKQRSRGEKSVGSEGWEDAESEEEKKGEEEEEEEEEEGGKTETEPSTSAPDLQNADHCPAVGAQNQPTSSQQELSESTLTERDTLLERQAHLPTTHKFSREPLYRAIKNQPPPIMSIELDHNPFKCPAADCTKSFRKGSLLHYHIKYYHSDQHFEGQASQQGTPWRKRSSSEGRDFLSERRKENQSNNNTNHRDKADHITTATEVKLEEGREEPEGGREEPEGGREEPEKEKRERRDFMRMKTKKRKKKGKKRRHTGLCSSDEERPPITLTLSTRHTHPPPHADEGSDWSTLTAESGEDSSPWPVTMEMEDCEVVRCVCEVEEENDFMIQCELCLCWQHGTCMGLYEDNVPHSYICYSCRDATGWKRGRYFLSDSDWLRSGHMFGLSCVRENYSELNASKITHTTQLLAHTLGLTQVLRGLQLKMCLLHCPTHPDLQLWRLPWRSGEGPTALANQRADAEGSNSGLAGSYVSSEHCYQKTEASWENEEKHENITASGTSQNYKDVGCVEVKVEESLCASAVECQLHLLEHMEALHSQTSTRMDLIERELDVLESWLDHSGELEPPDPLSRLPEIKQRIRRLLCDLGTVRRLSVIH
ncbi:PHD finger protein 20-like isoform X2 [Gadus macrocephalus]|uniref:PHD finger protein 20-like isoform X2 n=1 Tax=Gadus macrocephalus TaxID=80720 RepID=UPI0028CB67AE|nr:PHD finger protein 20-like isoform X2 [Gadus macrocephalus]